MIPAQQAVVAGMPFQLRGARARDNVVHFDIPFVAIGDAAAAFVSGTDDTAADPFRLLIDLPLPHLVHNARTALGYRRDAVIDWAHTVGFGHGAVHVCPKGHIHESVSPSQSTT